MGSRGGLVMSRFIDIECLCSDNKGSRHASCIHALQESTQCSIRSYSDMYFEDSSHLCFFHWYSFLFLQAPTLFCNSGNPCSDCVARDLCRDSQYSVFPPSGRNYWCEYSR